MTASAGSLGSTADAAGVGDGRSDPSTDDARRMRRAIVEIRREGWKVAVIYGVVDAALVTLIANLALST